MICFGDVARRIIGKPVQQILRPATSPTRYPPEITRIVSLRFTFAVTLSQQSFYRRQKTYQVISVVTAFGNQPAAVGAIGNGGNGSPGGDAGAQNSSQNTSHDVEEPSDATLSSPVLSATPPLASQAADPPSVKSYTCSGLGRDINSSARKKPTFDKEATGQVMTKDSGAEDQPLDQTAETSTNMPQESTVDDTERTPDKKRPRVDRCLPQESE